MLSMEEARQIAPEQLDGIIGCTEYATAYVFFNGVDADGGPDSPVVVMKETGETCGMTSFITAHGGGKLIRSITF